MPFSVVGLQPGSWIYYYLAASSFKHMYAWIHCGVFFETESCSVTQARGAISVHCNLCLPGARDSCVSLLSSWDYRHAPWRLANFCLFSRDEALTCWPGFSQTPGLRWSARGLPKCSDYRLEPLHLAPPSWRILLLILIEGRKEGKKIELQVGLERWVGFE